MPHHESCAFVTNRGTPLRGEHARAKPARSYGCARATVAVHAPRRFGRATHVSSASGPRPVRRTSRLMLGRPAGVGDAVGRLVRLGGRDVPSGRPGTAACGSGRRVTFARYE